MRIARWIANLFIVAMLVTIWAVPIAQACPMSADMSDMSMEVTASGGVPCCPDAGREKSGSNSACAAMLACSFQMPRLEVRFDTQFSNLVLSSIDWPFLRVDQLTQLDLAPPGHPPRS